MLNGRTGLPGPDALVWYNGDMNSKTIDPNIIARLSRYTKEELDPSSVEDRAGMEAYIGRNREAINRALEAGYLSLDAGRGTEISSLEGLLSALLAAKTV